MISTTVTDVSNTACKHCKKPLRFTADNREVVHSVYRDMSVICEKCHTNKKIDERDKYLRKLTKKWWQFWI